MKEVLISIQPKWIEKIRNQIGVRNGEPIYEKRIDVRKSRPKLKTPFKVRIYCTNSKSDIFYFEKKACNGKMAITGVGNGKVIGEFICRGIMRPHDSLKLMAKQSCLTEEELLEYSNGKTLYGWRIADLKIYDKPKELSEFATVCEGLKPYQCDKCEYSYTENTENGSYAECCCNNLKPLKRPPQSWCYVEG